jgi:peroxiredoxin
MAWYLRFLPAALCAAVLSGCAMEESTIPPIAIRAEAPAISGVASDGTHVKLSDFRGKVVLVDFWFDACGYCNKNHDNEQLLVQKYKGKPFVILGVNTDKDRATMTESEKRQHMVWPSIWDEGHQNASLYSVRAFPTVFLVDAQGRLATKPKAGLPDEKQLEKVIDQLLLEMDKDSDQTKAE